MGAVLLRAELAVKVVLFEGNSSQKRRRGELSRWVALIVPSHRSVSVLLERRTN